MLALLSRSREPRAQKSDTDSHRLDCVIPAKPALSVAEWGRNPCFGRGILETTRSANDTGYAWKIIATDGQAGTEGPTWVFATDGPSVEVTLHDWNSDDIVSIVGDVPPFVDCVYSQNCPGDVDTIAVGDCNGNAILSIVGDVPCFVDCVYFDNCDQ